jgi:hypothetical protein
VIHLITALRVARDAVLWGDPAKSTPTPFNRSTTADAVRSVVPAEAAENVLKIVATPLEGPWRWGLYFDGTVLHVTRVAVCNAPGAGGKPS